MAQLDDKLNSYEVDLMIPSSFRYLYKQTDVNLPMMTQSYLTVNRKIQTYINRDLEDDFHLFFEPSLLDYDSQPLRKVLQEKLKQNPVKDTSIDIVDIINFNYKNAIKYACGRMTYVVSDALDWTKTFNNVIRREVREELIDHIKTKISEGQAGMDCDVVTWENVLKELKEPICYV